MDNYRFEIVGRSKESGGTKNSSYLFNRKDRRSNRRRAIFRRRNARFTRESSSA
jgi:hypothetical protein